MRIETLHLTDLRYNPERGAFEALVRITDHGEEFRYPCEVKAPLHAEFALIARGMTAKARKMHSGATPGLRMRRADAALSPIPETHRPAPTPQATPLLQRMLGQFAA